MTQLQTIKTPPQLLQFLQDTMKYGFVADGKVYTKAERQQWVAHYKIRFGEDLIQAGYGACFDYAELQRSFFEKWGMEHECYFLRGYRAKKNKNAKTLPFHTFLIYKDGDKWKWFEYSFRTLRGIHEYQTKQQALADVVSKALEYHNCVQDKFDLYKYPKVTKNLTAIQFVKHCLRGERVALYTYPDG